MANMQKYKLSQARHVLGENLRDDGFDRERVDDSLTPRNYDLSGCPDARKALSEAVEHHVEVAGKALRKDANVLVSWVVTQPEDVRPEDSSRFFEAVTDFVRRRYPSARVIAATVHLDEPKARPHIHIDIIPTMPNGRLNASKTVGRYDLNGFHDGLSRAVEKALGYRTSVLLPPEERGRKALSKVPHEMLSDATKFLDEETRRHEERAAEAREGAEAAESELSALREEVEDLRGRVETAREAICLAARWARSVAGLVDALSDFVRESGLARRFADFARRRGIDLPALARGREEVERGLDRARDDLSR